jgi:hypothetical protein
LARLAWAQGELERSAEGLEEALAIGRQLDRDDLKAFALYYLGQAARLNNNWQLAQERFSEALTFFGLSERGGYCLCLEGFGALALEKGQAARAARLLGARQKLRASARTQDNYPFMVREREGHIARVRDQLDEGPFSAAWAEGEGMSEEQMLAYALEQDDA